MQGTQSVDVRGDLWRYRQRIGSQAHGHRCKVRIGGGEFAKQHGSFGLFKQPAPHGNNARHVCAYGWLVAPDQRPDSGQLSFDVHGAGRAQCAKAAVHFSADAASPGACLHALWPEGFGRKLFSHVFGNRQRVPNHKAIVHQRGYLANRGHVSHGLLEAGTAVKRVKANDDLFKRNVCLAKQHPGPH